MTSTTPPATIQRTQLRWMVRLEHVRPSRFGETPREGLAWAVTPHVGRRRDGALIGALVPSYFGSRSRALDYAHKQAERVYGGRRTR